MYTGIKMQTHTHTHTGLLGFGDHQRVTEEVSVLGLHAGLQLGVSVEEERPIGAAEEGLDQ